MPKTWETLGLLNSKRRKRIVSTSPDNTEIVCALGGIDDLVGISKHCDYPEGLSEEKPVVSDFAKADIEKIVALEPDIVLCSTYYQANIIHELAQHHLRVLVTQPSTLNSIYDNILLIANLLGRPEKGDMLVEHMQQTLTPQEPTGLRVFAEEWGDPIVYAAPWIQEIITLAGGTPVFPELAGYTHTKERYVSPEQVAQTQADIVLLSWCGFHGKIPVEAVLQRPGWDTLPAVQKNQIYPVEDTFFVRPGPRLTQGFQWLQSLFAECG